MLERCELMLRLRKGHGIYSTSARRLWVFWTCFFSEPDDIKATKDKSGNGSLLFFLFNDAELLQRHWVCVIFGTLGAPALAHANILSLYFSSKNQEGICLVLYPLSKTNTIGGSLKNNLPWFSVTLIPNFESKVLRGRRGGRLITITIKTWWFWTS